ncbi:flagellar hook-basal body protein [Ureibacillus sp. FSL K6-8385]|uniref:Flagellar hook-basal body protein n=1 Tax=Ureibacillus terrenus TaxID=118246 RepID=A0A540V2D5_9BACL|nr:flagellar hook-basal body protein [Ureibacillus terrenus]MED3661399.1 flagellar hook-basal body protein [Ureibacillus terrenus]MED3764128.1 flagellar hook-basal body protein [Ureibacillus terrenus]TQE90914.1 flagellar hook-basal body protein [Ureibacillus terrenus]
MLRTMLTATNTLSQIQQQIDTISNNIANINTAGYKAKEARFSEMLYQEYFNTRRDEQATRLTPQGIRYGVGAKISQIQTNHAQGALQTTNRDLDFAFTNERQYFNILMPDGNNGFNIVYSRQGNFYVSPVDDERVMLVNADGYPVADSEGNPIVFNDDVESFSLGENGVLTVTFANGTRQSFLLGITEIHKPQVMKQLSGSYIDLPENLAQLGFNADDILTNLIGYARQNIGLESGKLELSNVDLSNEMANLIQAQRSYQFNARAITISDQMLGLINGIR